MSKPAVPSATAGVAVIGTPSDPPDEEPRKLDDVLLAMDVVDTLRHRAQMVSRELDEEGREKELVQRLREIYAAQGIEVPERILRDGVKALAEQRFVYKPPRDGFGVRLAKAYVSRSRWLPAAWMGLGAILAAVLVWQFAWAGPRAAEWKRLPGEIAQLSAQAEQLAIDPDVDQRIADIASMGSRAVVEGDRRSARSQLKALREINETLSAVYDLRIVSRQGEDTGFYRVPNDNPSGRNYYLVVEAIAPDGDVLRLPVFNEETQKTDEVTKWAQRVSKTTFDRVAEDKAPDQIIQNDILGHKPRGVLQPDFVDPVPGGAITKW
ncbi:MAG: DUF6384 family protein [Hyphomonadaceae bacterium]